MTNYTKTMMESLAEVRGLQEDNMDLMRKAAKGAMQTIKFKDGKLKMDSFTASGIMGVYDKVNTKNKKAIENIINKGSKEQVLKLQSLAMKASGGASAGWKLPTKEETELGEVKKVGDTVTVKGKKGKIVHITQGQGGRPKKAFVEFPNSKKTPAQIPLTDLDEGKEKDARQLVNPNKEVMVVKKSKVIVIDKKDQDKYLKQGWTLAEEDEVEEAKKPVSQMTPKEKAADAKRRKEYKAYQKSKRDEEVEIDEAVDVKDFDSLKKGDTVTIEYKSTMSSGTATFKVTAKNIVGKAKVHKATLQNVKNPKGVKFFLYKRGNKVSLAQGDMAASIVKYTIEEVEESHKIECPKCKGEGCEHCNGKGYHIDEVKIDEATVLSITDVDQWTHEIYKGIKAGWKSVAKSTLGGDENVAIMIKVTVEPEKDWPNKILHNAKYGMIRIATDGTNEDVCIRS